MLRRYDAESISVILEFADTTDLVVEIEPRLACKVSCHSWAPGDQRLSKNYRKDPL